MRQVDILPKKGRGMETYQARLRVLMILGISFCGSMISAMYLSPVKVVKAKDWCWVKCFADHPIPMQVPEGYGEDYRLTSEDRRR